MAELPAFVGTPRENEIYHTDALTLLRAMPDASVDLVVTDPPYGVTANAWDNAQMFMPWTEIERVTKEDAAIVVTAMQPYSSALVMSNLNNFRYEWVLEKDNGTDFLNVNRKPFEVHEVALVFYRRQPVYNPQMTHGKAYGVVRLHEQPRMNLHQSDVTKNTRTLNNGTRYPRTVQRFKWPARTNHPTQKPVALMEYLIRTYSRPGDLVLDPFMGSGTTAVAARNLGRRFVGCDISHEYVTIARKRLQTTDPFQPTMHENGVTQMSLFSREVVAQ